MRQSLRIDLLSAPILLISSGNVAQVQPRARSPGALAISTQEPFYVCGRYPDRVRDPDVAKLAALVEALDDGGAYSELPRHLTNRKQGRGRDRKPARGRNDFLRRLGLIWGRKLNHLSHCRLFGGLCCGLGRGAERRVRIDGGAQILDHEVAIVSGGNSPDNGLDQATPRRGASSENRALPNLRRQLPSAALPGMLVAMRNRGQLEHPIERGDIDLHGERYSYRIAGSGPPVVLLHGIAASSETWNKVMPRLTEHHTVIAPDLLGHGQSAKPPGDYSLGAYANLVRDLLDALGKERSTIVGHSLGGGVALQFSYQFPERTERLVLVSSGGLGREVHPILRAAALQGADVVLPWLSVGSARGIGTLVKTMGRFGFRASVDLGEAWRSFVALEDPAARRAFLQTVRGLIDLRGQRVSANDRLYLTADLPTLIVWGEKDPLIPVSHAHAAHKRMPGSRLEIFPDVGHFPHLDDSERFAGILLDFFQTSAPSAFDPDRQRRRLRVGPKRARRAQGSSR